MEALRHTNKDPNQCTTSEHDEILNAKRVIIVGGQIPEFRMPKFEAPLAIAPEPKVIIERIEVPLIVEKEVLVYIDKPVIVEREKLIIEKIEVPVIQYQTKVEVVEKIVEKPVFITVPQVEYKDLPKWLKICLAAQIFGTIIMLLKMILK